MLLNAFASVLTSGGMQTAEEVNIYPVWLSLLVFAMVRQSTDNLLMTMVMHVTFNGLNVLMSYANLEAVPNWIIIMILIVGAVSFFILFFLLLSRNPVLVEKGRYKRRCALTKEGYVSIAICLSIMGMLFAL